MVATDISTLLQLACLKHTGEYLPINVGNFTAWSYTFKDGKKQGKFNPFADNLLTNPFRTLTDTHPIQHRIMRNILHDELKKVFTYKIEIADIYAGMIGYDFRSLLTPDEIRALCWAKHTILNQGEYLLHSVDRDTRHWYNWLNDTLNHREIADIANYPKQRRVFGYGWGEKYLVLCLSMLTYNPRIKSVLDKFYTKTDPKIEKIQNIVKNWIRLEKEWSPVSNRNFNDIIVERHLTKWRNKSLPCWGYPHCSFVGHRSSIEGNIACLQTGYSIPPVKRDTWLYWFMWKIIYDKEAGVDLNHAHRRRTNAKVNFWEHIKKESGLYIPLDKTKHQERLVTSIIQQ